MVSNSFYTSDMSQSIEHLKEKGIKFLDVPFLNSVGETWVYFTTTWGMGLAI